MCGTADTGMRVVCAVLLILLTACGEEQNNPPPPDIPFLTSDAYFRIGGHVITVPMIALRGPDHIFTLSREKPAKSRKQILTEQASDPHSPMPVESLALLIHQYEMRDQHGASREICQPLARTWAQVVCRGQQKGVLGRLPEKFDLLDRAKLDLLKHRYTVGGEQEYDHVKGMTMRPGITEVGCDKASKFCTAVVETSPGLLAVWTVWDDDRGDGVTDGRATRSGHCRIRPKRDRTDGGQEPRDGGVTASALARS
jgi:hypothetical protein